MRVIEIILILSLIFIEINSYPYTICLNDCSGKGKCKKGKCECFFGFSGMDCSESVCEKDLNWFETSEKNAQCSGRGNCIIQKCECDPGFFGATCNSFNYTDKAICEVHGEYVHLNTLTQTDDPNEKRIYGCICKNGFSGINCEKSNAETCPFGVNITTVNMTIHYSEFTISKDKTAILIAITKSGKTENIGDIKDKTISQIIEIIKDSKIVKMVKISRKGSKLVDISESDEKLNGGNGDGGSTFRFTFTSDKDAKVTEVIEGNTAIDSSGVINSEITLSEFTITKDKTAKYILMKTDDDVKIVNISTNGKISDIITAITNTKIVSDVRIYKYDNENSKWEDISDKSDGDNTLTAGTKYKFIFPSDSKVKITKLTDDKGDVTDGSITNNEITTSDFTIASDKTAKYILMKTDDDVKIVNISTNGKISDIITAITTSIKDVRIYKYDNENSKWEDISDISGDNTLTTGTKYKFIFPSDSKVKITEITDSLSDIITPGGSSKITYDDGNSNYYTEANSVFTITGSNTIIITIQNTKSYSTSLSTIITDVNKEIPDKELSSIQIKFISKSKIDDIITAITNSTIVKMVKICKYDGDSCHDISNNKELLTGETTGSTYKFTFPLDPYATVKYVTSGESIVDSDIVYETTTPAISSSKFTIKSDKTANYITILNNGITKVINIKDKTSISGIITAIKAVVDDVTICKCTADSDNCKDSCNNELLTAGSTYKFTFTGGKNAKVLDLTDGESVVGDITVNKNVFNDISVFGKSIVISQCSGHGICAENYVCSCKSGYQGDDCQLANPTVSPSTTTTICPFGYSWFGINNNIIHGLNECSNQGVCDGGICKCNDLFTGDNCEKLNMKCKNSMKLEEMNVNNNESNIFENINIKCDCGSLYSGNDCSKGSCPYGPIDEIGSGKTPPYYVLTCPTTPPDNIAKTNYRFEFTNIKKSKQTSRKLRIGYTPKYWRKILERINIMRSEVIITNNPTTTSDYPTIDYSDTTKYSICDETNRPTIDASNKIESYRIYLPGVYIYCMEDLTSPLGLKLIKDNSEGELSKDKDITIELITKDGNTIKCSECSGHGECNRVRKACKCNAGYSSSNIKYTRPSDKDKTGASISDGDFKSKFSLASGMKGDCSFTSKS